MQPDCTVLHDGPVGTAVGAGHVHSHTRRIGKHIGKLLEGQEVGPAGTWVQGGRAARAWREDIRAARGKPESFPCATCRAKEPPGEAVVSATRRELVPSRHGRGAAP